MEQPERLPSFRYHPDPVATGSVRADADAPCLNCSRVRGYVYTGSVWTDKPFILTDHLCPWCIADGSAARRFGATFNDTGAVDLPIGVREEIERRTPGYTAWQQEGWLACCGDGAAFFGPAGARELRERFPEAIAAIEGCLRDEYELSNAELRAVFETLDVRSEPTAYVFRCLHCAAYLGYVDRA